MKRQWQAAGEDADRRPAPQRDVQQPLPPTQLQPPSCPPAQTQTRAQTQPVAPSCGGAVAPHSARCGVGCRPQPFVAAAAAVAATQPQTPKAEDGFGAATSESSRRADSRGAGPSGTPAGAGGGGGSAAADAVYLPAVVDEAEPSWTAEQQYAIDLATRGKSFYLCGPAGTGKTVLINEIADRLDREHRVVAVTAMTGVAACLLGSRGQTMHSWAGIGLALANAETLAAKMTDKARKRWRETDLLIVDECSMLSSSLLEKLHRVAQLVRGETDFFGGLPLLLVGDLHQLSPVRATMLYPHSPTFAHLAMRCVMLTRIFRQSDARSLQVLAEVRVGRMSRDTLRYLCDAARACSPLDDDAKTVLCPRNKEVDDRNEAKLRTLPGDETVYRAVDSGRRTMAILTACSLPSELRLKVGARVMYLRNNGKSGRDRLVNGSVGVVVGLEDVGVGEPLPFVRWDATGAVSRVNRVTERHGSEDEDEDEDKDEDEDEDEDEEDFRRFQLPLRLAWAITIHKAQGMTLQQVEIDLKGCFAKGQAYVALSRCPDLSRVRILNFTPNVVKTDPDVLRLYERRLEVQRQARLQASQVPVSSGCGAAVPVANPCVPPGRPVKA